MKNKIITFLKKEKYTLMFGVFMFVSIYLVKFM